MFENALEIMVQALKFLNQCVALRDSQCVYSFYVSAVCSSEANHPGDTKQTDLLLLTCELGEEYLSHQFFRGSGCANACFFSSFFFPSAPSLSHFCLTSLSLQKSVKEGILLKQTSSFQRWKRRYFKLRGRTLYYAKDCKVRKCAELLLADQKLTKQYNQTENSVLLQLYVIERCQEMGDLL